MKEFILNMYLIIEYYTNGFNLNLLSLISVIAILCAIYVIISENPIFSVLFLIGLFGSISLYLIMIGLTFIGLSYLIVYIGAVSILFLFILMLIDIRISELESNTKNSMPLAIIIMILFNYSFFQVLPSKVEILNNNIITYNIIGEISSSFFISLYNNINYYNLYYVTGVVWDGYLAEMDHITNIGNIMYTNYSMWLIMASFILLLAMVGSIVITLKLKGDSSYNEVIKNEDV